MWLQKHVFPMLLIWSLWVGCTLAGRAQSKRSQLNTCRTTNTVITPRLFPELGSERIKSTYGPFIAPAGSENHGMDVFKCSPPLPCKDCTILYMHAGLEYPDGRDAVVENGVMLHHVVFQNLMRKDAVCARKRQERFFASGDERTPVDLTSGGLREYGYMLHSKEKIALSLEIMNIAEQAKDVYLTVEWEYFPSIPRSFKSVQPYWLDVGNCGSSSKPAKEDSVFQYSSQTAKAPTSGTIAVAVAHLHSGGTHLEVTREGAPICTSHAEYENGHITGMTTCDDLSYAKGDEFSITAYYNTSEHAPMKHHDNELEPVMGIAIVYAVEDRQHHRHVSWEKIGKVTGVVFGLGLVFGLSFMWDRKRRRDSKNIVPVWLQRQYKEYRGVIDMRLQSQKSRQSYEPLLGDSSPERLD